MYQNRAEDWPQRLNEIIAQYSTQRFEWGKSDCGTLACDVVRAIIGVDLYSEFAGSYNSEREFRKLLVRNRCESIGDLFAKSAKKYKIKPAQSMRINRGDITVYSDPYNGESLGVCVGHQSMHHFDIGLIAIPISSCTQAWSVGNA